MVTLSIPKSEYSKIIKTQERLKKRVDLLQKMFKEAMQDEIRPEYIKKLDRIDSDIDKGKCTRFSNVLEAKKFLDNL